MTWQARVYGGVKSDGNIPKPSSVPHKPPGMAQERINGEDGAILSVFALDSATVEIARKRLRTMHELGQSWYALGKLYEKPAGTIQHWANGRGRMDDETVETILKTRLHYVTIDPGSVIVLAPGETVRRPGQPRQRTRYWRPCLPVTLTPQQREMIENYAATLAGRTGQEGGA